MFRKILRNALILLIVLVTGLWIFKAYADAYFLDGYDAYYPLNAAEESVEAVDDTKEVFGVDVTRQYRRQAFSFDARDGDTVPGLITLPTQEAERYPAIVFVHGSGQEKEFIERICTPFNQAGFAMVSYDQYMCGGREIEGGILKKGLGWRDRAWKTICDTRRLIDYLQTRPDIAPDRIYLVGASWGAITGTTVVAQDKRIKAAVLVVGGGDIDVLLDAPLIVENVPGPALLLAKPVARYFMSAADPVYFGPQTTPTPVLMQCGSDDRLVSPQAGEALYASLGEPKELRWYPIDHPGLRKTDGPEILRMLNDGLEWLLAHDQPHRPEAPSEAPAAPEATQTPAVEASAA